MTNKPNQSKKVCMCLIVFSFDANKDYKFILAGNRDEYYERESLPFKWYRLSNGDELLSPKDLRAGGSWFGVTKKGKIAFLTNYRNPSLFKIDAPSRGNIVWDYLSSNYNPKNYIKTIDTQRFNPFNLLFGHIDKLYYFSNIQNKLIEVEKGIHGLSNHFLDSPWPKVKKAISSFKKILSESHSKDLLISRLLVMLKDNTIFEDDLPDTGIGIKREKLLSPIFVESENYGTQTSYVLTLDMHNRAFLLEKNHIRNTINTFNFEISK